MAKLFIFTWLLLSSLLVTAQEIEPSRWLTSGYQPQSVEQALATLTATNRVEARTVVTYKAGQSVVLEPGFEAKAGSVFTAHTGIVSLPALDEGKLNSLTLLTYPNPFAEVTTITYVLTKPSRTSLHIRDAEGRLIRQLVDDHYQEAGRHSVEWRGGEVPAGTYVCVLDIGTQRLSRRIIRK